MAARTDGACHGGGNRVAEGGLAEGVEEARERLGGQAGQRAQHHARRGHEERIEQPHAHRRFPGEEGHGHGQRLPAQDG